MKFLAFVAFCIISANCAVFTSIAPFSGNLNEDFETFTTSSVLFGQTSLSVFGGKGTISDSATVVCQSGTFGLAGPSAQAHSGHYFFGHNAGSGSATLSIPSGTTTFGGYFGYAEPASNPMTFQFYSGQTLLATMTFSYDANSNGGQFVWFGVSSDTAFDRVVMTAYYFVFDSLTINGGVCGNGIVEAGEQCDGGSCCNGACAFVSSASVCRAAAGPCDVAETCTGNSASCPADSYSLSSVVCRPAANSCDLVETCTGSSASCPADLISQSLTCFCSRQDLPGGAVGMYCNANTGYYQCQTGPWAALSVDRACPAGTYCGCPFGVECTCGGTRTPCISASSNSVGGMSSQTC